ncbi:GIY-YIG nuclease family protein [Alkalibacter mobilis]|uniref:GIY-YIG nuclease family protein n=1 Tax=Alkalibacter mobilis TaxID=2787712 RepID=UPI00189EA35F|nr:GIY-YIG nuclease family protein [Alkalibacter mobilis]MBF7097071.1 GIY-YIG nuclease family protein [Alkalibacter mobilis]
MYFVYILRCKDNTLYTGITTNLDRRLKEHNRGTASKYTRIRKPVSLEYWETSPNRSEASKREAEIKKLCKNEKELLITRRKAHENL